MDLRTLLGLLASLTVVATGLLGAGLVAPASAQGLSAGCESLNHPVRDRLYSGAGFRAEFAAGERISIAAGLPTGVGTPTTVTLYVSPGDLENPLIFPGARVVVDTASFPGTVEYTFPAAGTHHVDWTAGFAGVTWTVSCAAGGDPVGQLEGVATDLEAIVDAGAGTKLGDKAEDALAKLEAALAKLEKSPPDRQGALGELEGAVGDLEAAVKDRLLDSSEGTALLDRLAGAARLLAEEAIADANARGGAADKIAEAERAIQRGDAKRASGRFKDAVAQYKDAVSKAEGAAPASAGPPLRVCPSGCPYTSIADALAAARSGDKLVIGAGTYGGGFTIGIDVALLGAGQQQTTISGGGPVVTVGQGAAVKIRNVTVRDGSGSGNGGGIANFGTLTVTDTTVSGSFADSGGGIYNAGTLTLKNTTLTGNSVDFQGGALFNAGRVAVADSVVTANGPCACAGPGIANTGTLTAKNTTISDNGLGLSGGGLINLFGTATLVDSTVSGNTTGYEGGGIFNLGGTLILKGTRVTGNAATITAGGGYPFTGGGIANEFGTMTLKDSVVSGNAPDDVFEFP